MANYSMRYCEENPHPLDSFRTEGVGEVHQGQLALKDFPPLREMWTLREIVELKR